MDSFSIHVASFHQECLTCPYPWIKIHESFLCMKSAKIFKKTKNKKNSGSAPLSGSRPKCIPADRRTDRNENRTSSADVMNHKVHKSFSKHFSCIIHFSAGSEPWYFKWKYTQIPVGSRLAWYGLQPAIPYRSHIALCTMRPRLMLYLLPLSGSFQKVRRALPWVLLRPSTKCHENLVE